MTAAIQSSRPIERAAASSPPVRLAVIGPSFFSYVQDIVDRLTEKGVPAACFGEKHSEGVLSKLLYRLGLYNHRWAPKHAHLAWLRAAIKASEATDVLLVNVETIDRAFVQGLVDEERRVHVYMWDGVANKPGFVSYLDLLEGRGSFDPLDCERFDLTYIPLFAGEAFDASQWADEGEPEFDIAFCGTVHSSRIAIAAELLTADWARRRRIALMLYYHSRALLFIKGLVEPAVWRIVQLVSYRPFGKAEIARMMRRSRFVLDIPHHGQTGMTARTFEALMSGSRLLTFHRRVRELIPASLQDRITVIDDIRDAAAIDFDEHRRLPSLTSEERYFLSIDRFVDQLLAMAGVAANRHGTKAPE